MKKDSVHAHEDTSYSVLRLSVARLLHIREVQALWGGHLVQVARELGYVHARDGEHHDELTWLEAQLAQAAHVRKRRGDALLRRLKEARRRLGIRQLPAFELCDRDPRFDD